MELLDEIEQIKQDLLDQKETQQANGEEENIASLLTGAVQDGDLTAMERLQKLLNASLDNGQSIFFPDLTRSLWEIKPRPDLNEEDAFESEDEELVSEPNEVQHNNLLDRFDRVQGEVAGDKPELIIETITDSFPLDSNALMRKKEDPAEDQKEVIVSPIGTLEN